MPPRIVPPPFTTLVRAYCPIGHSWVTLATIVTSWPRGSRHSIQSETLTDPHCSGCGSRFVRFQDCQHGYTP